METHEVWAYRDQAQLGHDSTAGSDITGYGVEAQDGSIGKIDAANNDVGQSYVIVDTGPWIFGRKVMLPAGVIYRIDRDEQKAYVNLIKEQIKDAPEYDQAMASDDRYRSALGTYYGHGGPGHRAHDESL